MATPAQDLRDLLVGDSSLGLAAGVNIYTGPVRAASTAAGVPINCMFVKEASGAPPMRVMTEANEIRSVVVQIIYRSAKEQTGHDLMMSIMNSLIGQTPTGYLDMFTNQSAPNHAGPDENDHHKFTLNYLMRYEQAAA